MAEAELQDAAAWYEERSPGLGLRFVQAVRKKTDELLEAPERWAISQGSRRTLLGRFPYALSITRQTKLRAVVAMAAANYNLPNEPTDTNAAPIAYMGTAGMSDTTCPWVGSDAQKQGGKYCALEHAQDNGCTIPSGNNIPTTTAGSKKYLCYDFAGCRAGYPVKACTFDGAHTPSSVDDGISSGDDGLKAFVPPLAWSFISQF